MSRTPPVPKRPPQAGNPGRAARRHPRRGAAARLRRRGLRAGQPGARGAPRAPAAAVGEFVEAGWQGDMGWLGERTEERADPQRLWRGRQDRRVAGAELRAGQPIRSTC